MNTQIKNQIISLAKNNPTEEICGFIYFGVDGKAGIRECKNISEDKNRSFIISSDEYISLIEDDSKYVCGIYHSHINTDEEFSWNDIEISDNLELPIFVFSLKTNKWNDYTPQSYEVPDVGVPFCWGFSDCYETVRNDFRKRGIFISDYDRDDSFGVSNDSIILDNFEKEGFEAVPGNNPIIENDVILFKVKTNFPKHLAVFKGSNRMLHHSLHKNSSIDMLDRFWINKINMVLRYRGK